MEAGTSRQQGDETEASGNGAAAKSQAKPKQLESFSPSTGQLVGSVDTITPEQVQAIVDEVGEVQPFWALLSLEDRARYFRRAADVLLEELDELAELLSTEQGKPRVESYTMELLPTIDALKWIADSGPDILADEKVGFPQAFLLTKKAKFSYEPIGVVGVIAPWNYPWSIPFGEVAIALMAGNGVVLKPASLTPLIGERIRQVFEKAGFPEGLSGPSTAAAPSATRSPSRRRGRSSSPARSRSATRSAAPALKQMKGSVLELGGKDPQIVCSDADIANAVSGAVWGGFANAGQTCSGIERVYVHARCRRRVPARASSARPSGSRSETRSTGTARSARWSRPTRPTW